MSTICGSVSIFGQKPHFLAILDTIKKNQTSIYARETLV